jgi:hypothetical protein
MFLARPSSRRWPEASIAPRSPVRSQPSTSADAVFAGVAYAEFDPRHRTADRSGAKRHQVVDREHGAALRQAVADRDREAEPVEEVGQVGLHEGAAGDDHPQPAAEAVVQRLEQGAR